MKMSRKNLLSYSAMPKMALRKLEGCTTSKSLQIYPPSVGQLIGDPHRQRIQGRRKRRINKTKEEQKKLENELKDEAMHK